MKNEKSKKMKNGESKKVKKRIKCKICITNKFFKIKTSCNHKICLDCLTKLRKAQCPFCRNDLKNELPDNIIKIINNNNIENINNNNQSTFNQGPFNDFNSFFGNNNNEPQTLYSTSSFSFSIDTDGFHVNNQSEGEPSSLLQTGLNLANMFL